MSLNVYLYSLNTKYTPKHFQFHFSQLKEYIKKCKGKNIYVLYWNAMCQAVLELKIRTLNHDFKSVHCIT